MKCAIIVVFILVFKSIVYSQNEQVLEPVDGTVVFLKGELKGKFMEKQSRQEISTPIKKKLDLYHYQDTTEVKYFHIIDMVNGFHSPVRLKKTNENLAFAIKNTYKGFPVQVIGILKLDTFMYNKEKKRGIKYDRELTLNRFYSITNPVKYNESDNVSIIQLNNASLYGKNSGSYGLNLNDLSSGEYVVIVATNEYKKVIITYYLFGID